MDNKVVIPEDAVAITTVDQFAQYLYAWHDHHVALCEHMLDIPEGSSVNSVINDVDEGIIELSGDMRKAFRAGITFALSQLGTLPFKDLPDPESADEQPDTTPKH